MHNSSLNVEPEAELDLSIKSSTHSNKTKYFRLRQFDERELTA